MNTINLLGLLADGEFHSGVEMGSALGVSRTAIWKALGKLEDEGVFVEVVKGKGYRVKGGLDLLDEGFIQAHLKSKSIELGEMSIFQNIDSTNSFLMREDFSDDGYSLCLAERQTSGRGRRGREWHSPYAKNIYLSIGFGLSGGGDALEGLSLALGVAVANCLSEQGIKGVGLKWPNDVWVEGKKLAGILVELKGEAGVGWRVVAGLGVNILMSEVEKGQIEQPWTSIAELSGGQDASRSLWAALIIESFVNTIERYRTQGLQHFLRDWERYDILKGRNVMLSIDGRTGLCSGVDSRGRLLVELDGKVTAVNAGEVSVRPNDSSS